MVSMVFFVMLMAYSQMKVIMSVMRGGMRAGMSM